jgi:hypothetical protein
MIPPFKFDPSCELDPGADITKREIESIPGRQFYASRVAAKKDAEKDA